jgi:hypothetical protein
MDRLTELVRTTYSNQVVISAALRGVQFPVPVFKLSPVEVADELMQSDKKIKGQGPSPKSRISLNSGNQKHGFLETDKLEHLKART